MNPQENLQNTTKDQASTHHSSLKEIVRFIVVAAIVVAGVRAFIAQPFIVNGASMDPTFDSGQYLIVDQLTYHFDNPERGEVVIFKYPKDPKTFFIKRVIGLPGDTVKIERGEVTIFNETNPDGIRLDEPYVAQYHMSDDSFKVTLSPTEYFVMGDNRAQSSDSRSWGPLERDYIVGRPILRLFPPNEATVFPGEFKQNNK
ncbi:MAG: signal peptidase I [Patescibacteria group bacterium]